MSMPLKKRKKIILFIGFGLSAVYCLILVLFPDIIKVDIIAGVVYYIMFFIWLQTDADEYSFVLTKIHKFLMLLTPVLPFFVIWYFIKTRGKKAFFPLVKIIIYVLINFAIMAAVYFAVMLAVNKIN
jgi:hypothetical protein